MGGKEKVIRLNPFRFLSDLAGTGRLRRAQEEANRVLEAAEEEKRSILLEAREEAVKTRTSVDNDLKERRKEVQRQERRVSQREENLEEKFQSLAEKEQGLKSKEDNLSNLREELVQLKEDQLKQLEETARLSYNDAKDILFKKAEDGVKHELARRYYELEKQTKEEAEQKARRVITMAINRLATDVVSESTTSAVQLPNDEMKGRLIGREGRNIKVLESLTGVDVIIDDTPGVVTVSCFDPVRRETARLTLEKLVADGRIQPARIEEMVERTQNEMDETMQREGDRAVLEAGVTGLDPDLVKLLGRLKYRYSYGENQLHHAVEVSLLSGMMAAEIGANIEVAKAGGLLHDIGKALTHEVEGPHAEIGAEVARRYGIHPEVHRAIMEHHDEDRGSVEAFLVATADAISAARPGSRKETLEHYVKRLEDLENVASSFPGIEKAFAIQAGREVRIMVKPDNVDDVAASNLARDVAKKIQDDLVFPGQIKVTVIRESRSVEFAR
ncbi:MAG: ribonuclease Y [Dehalococcoidia bacterium]|nr:ribonuclease Y [Dehalococcoidia bacterium]